MPLVAIEIGTNVMRCVARGALRFASLEELLTEPAVTEALQSRRAIALSGLFIDPYGLTCNTEIAQRGPESTPECESGRKRISYAVTLRALSISMRPVACTARTGSPLWHNFCTCISSRVIVRDRRAWARDRRCV